MFNWGEDWISKVSNADLYRCRQVEDIGFLVSQVGVGEKLET